MTRGDIVETAYGQIGVIVGHPFPNTFPPTTSFVLIMREDERFGGFEGACLYINTQLKKVGEVAPDENNEYGRPAKQWQKERNVKI